MSIPRRCQIGFSLLEVLIAFSILALSLGILLRIFSGDGRLAGLGEEHARAVVLAQSLLANAGVEKPLQTGEFSGDIDERYSWVMQVSPFTAFEEPLPEQLTFKPFWVELTIVWGEEPHPNSFSLGTIKLVSSINQAGGIIR
jgi:general secretion pathway protein I